MAKDIVDLKNYELYYGMKLDKLKIKNNYDMIEYSMDQIWYEAKKRYLKEVGIDDIKSISNDIVYNYFKDTCKYELLNMLIGKIDYNFRNKEEILFYELDNRNEFFINNIDAMIKIILDEYIYEDDIINKDNYHGRLSKIDKKESIMMVKDILYEIEPMGEWVNIYQELIDNNKIKYLNELSKKELDKIKNEYGINKLDSGVVYQKDDNKILDMFLKYEGNIKDIYTTIHEIIHYINRVKDNGRLNQIIQEMPSIFYEFYTLDYLKRLGYKEKEVNLIRKERAKYIKNACEEISDIGYYLYLYNRDGVINKDNDITTIYNYYTDSYERVLITSEDIIMYPYMIFIAYPYIIGTYLANKAIKKSKDDELILPIMKYITENISRMDIDRIFSIFDSDIDLYKDKDEKIKIKKKMR